MLRTLLLVISFPARKFEKPIKNPDQPKLTREMFYRVIMAIISGSENLLRRTWDYSAVVGSITDLISETLLAGNPPL